MWDTQFLCWSVALGTPSLVPVITIPVLSTNGFRHKSVMWGWALAFGFVVLYITLAEIWKLAQNH